MINISSFALKFLSGSPGQFYLSVGPGWGRSRQAGGRQCVRVVWKPLNVFNCFGQLSQLIPADGEGIKKLEPARTLPRKREPKLEKPEDN